MSFNEKMITLASIIFLIKVYGILQFAMKPLDMLINLIQMFYGLFSFTSYMQIFLLKIDYLLHLNDTMPKCVFLCGSHLTF
jgi:hypothetical protein